MLKINQQIVILITPRLQKPLLQTVKIVLFQIIPKSTTGCRRMKIGFRIYKFKIHKKDMFFHYKSKMGLYVQNKLNKQK